MTKNLTPEIDVLKDMPERLDKVEEQATHWLASHAVPILRVAVGIVFFWFGVLKFFPGMSPAQGLAVQTIDVLTFGLMPEGVSLVLLASLECAIGIGFVTGKFMRLTLGLLTFQMAGAVSPLFIFPGETFLHVPYSPTLEGQYIIKNLVLIAAGLVVGATVRGGCLVAHPEVAQKARQQDSELCAK